MANNSTFINVTMTNISAAIERPFFPLPLKAVLCTITAGGIIGNIFLFITFSSKNFKNQTFSVYFRLLALIDTLVLVTATIIYFIDRRFQTESHDNSEESIGIKITCRLFYLISDVTHMASPWFLAIIATDRMLVFYLPFRFQRFAKKRTAWMIGIGTIAIAILLHVPEVVVILTGNSSNRSLNYCGGYRYPVDGIENFRIFKGTALVFLVPIVLTLAMNVALMCKIKKQLVIRKGYRVNDGLTNGKQREAVISARFVVVTATSVILWLPMFMMNTMRHVDVFLTKEDALLLDAIEREAWPPSYTLRLITFGFHFYILLLVWRYFRSAFISIIFLWKKREARNKSISREPVADNLPLSGRE